MTRFQVDSDEVLATAATIRATIGRIQAEVGGLRGQLVTLQNSWTGQAATSFQGVVTEWLALQQRVEDNLAALNQSLAHAGQQYAEVEQQNVLRFAR